AGAAAATGHAPAAARRVARADPTATSPRRGRAAGVGGSGRDRRGPPATWPPVPPPARRRPTARPLRTARPLGTAPWPTTPRRRSRPPSTPVPGPAALAAAGGAVAAAPRPPRPPPEPTL